jgi:hypothetical protein
VAPILLALTGGEYIDDYVQAKFGRSGSKVSRDPLEGAAQFGMFFEI